MKLLHLQGTRTLTRETKKSNWYIKDRKSALEIFQIVQELFATRLNPRSPPSFGKNRPWYAPKYAFRAEMLIFFSSSMETAPTPPINRPVLIPLNRERPTILKNGQVTPVQLQEGVVCAKRAQTGRARARLRSTRTSASTVNSSATNGTARYSPATHDENQELGYHRWTSETHPLMIA